MRWPLAACASRVPANKTIASTITARATPRPWRQDFNATVVFLTPEMRRAIDDQGQLAEDERVEAG